MKKGINLIAFIAIVIGIILAIIIASKVFFVNSENFKKSGKSVKELKFSLEDLKNNKIGPEKTLIELKEKFGEVQLYDSYVETITGDNVEIYSNNRGISFILRNNKLSTLVITSEDYEFSGIKIGDSKEKVINTYLKENVEKNVISEDGIVIGQYLYGSYRVEDLEKIKIEDKVEYAYISSNIENEKKDEYDYLIKYVYMGPPYIKGYATEYDKIACIEFKIKNEKVISFASQVDSWKK